MSDEGKITPIKGFRQQKKPTRAAVTKENDLLKQQLQSLAQTDKLIGQQVFQFGNLLNRVNQETTTMAGLLRKKLTSGPIKKDDNVMLDFMGILTETGKLFDGSYLLGSVIQVGSGNFVLGFEDGLIGMKVGETKNITFTFPENYPEKLKGKKYYKK